MSKKEAQARYRAKNAERIREAGAAYRAANRDAILAKKAAAYAIDKYGAAAYVEANRAVILEKKRLRYEANKAAHLEAGRRWREANPEKVKQIREAYRAARPEVDRAANAKRRAAKNGARGQMSPGIELKLLKLQKGKCANCSCCLAKSGHHLDHVMPLARGGDHVDANAQLLCPTCNVKKHAKDPIDWAQENGRLL